MPVAGQTMFLFGIPWTNAEFGGWAGRNPTSLALARSRLHNLFVPNSASVDQCPNLRTKWLTLLAPPCRDTIWHFFGVASRRAGQNAKAKAPAAKMPNPSIAIAVASYAGSMNIREYLCVVRHTLVAGRTSQTHEIQRPKMCERFGSATRLKAGSHPIGGRESVVTTGDGTVGVCFEASGSRSPLWV
jgi:hypothetical protein